MAKWSLGKAQQALWRGTMGTRRTMSWLPRSVARTRFNGSIVDWATAYELAPTHAYIYIYIHIYARCELRIANGEWLWLWRIAKSTFVRWLTPPVRTIGTKGSPGKQLAVDRMQSQNLSTVHYKFNMHRTHAPELHAYTLYIHVFECTGCISDGFDPNRMESNRIDLAEREIIAHLIIIESSWRTELLCDYGVGQVLAHISPFFRSSTLIFLHSTLENQLKPFFLRFLKVCKPTVWCSMSIFTYFEVHPLLYQWLSTICFKWIYCNALFLFSPFNYMYVCIFIIYRLYLATSVGRTLLSHKPSGVGFVQEIDLNYLAFGISHVAPHKPIT